MMILYPEWDAGVNQILKKVLLILSKIHRINFEVREKILNLIKLELKFPEQIADKIIEIKIFSSIRLIRSVF
jgi:hypothetical protein